MVGSCCTFGGKMQQDSEHIFHVAIIGGGLAGLTTAIQLAQLGHEVVVFEKKDFPRHKVCGEYVSNEVLPVLSSFGIDPFNSGATRISRFELSAPSGKIISAPLPLGAFGLSRYRLDQLLADKAKELGVKIVTREKVNQVTFRDELFLVETNHETVRARFAVGAFGKTSNFSSTTPKEQKKNEQYIAVKHHFRMDFPDDLVALHNFKGGYCGVSRVEDDRVNVCYLATAEDLNRSGSIQQFERDVLWRNPHLKAVFGSATELFERPLTISNFSFGAKNAVADHILMAGDAAGMISPLCGNGMAMAIHSGFRLGKLLHDAIGNNISRAELERQYSREWKNRFSTRMWWGNQLQSLFGRPTVANTALSALSVWPGLTPAIIQQTHGKATLV